jgi:ABC-2 type transport system ATP-binding protein
MIKLENLTKKFGDLIAISDLTFKIEKGEIFGLLGPNGAGKTTTIRILTTLLKPTSGKAWVGGYDVDSKPLRVKEMIGLVPQGINLEMDLTTQENLEFHGRLHRMARGERDGKIDELLSFVELEEKRDIVVEHLSGGMKRRLLIARALMHNPQVLFLDEPTVGLDPQVRRKIWDLIRDLKTKGFTILLTTHYIEEADALCDRVGILRKGKLIALDSPSTLKKDMGETAVECREGEHFYKFFRTRDEAIDYARGLDCDVIIRESNLEDVFIKLTGERISD